MLLNFYFIGKGVKKDKKNKKLPAGERAHDVKADCSNDNWVYFLRGKKGGFEVALGDAICVAESTITGPAFG